MTGQSTSSQPARWLNRTVLGIGRASLLSDWSHEIATAVMPPFLATVNGVGDFLSSVVVGALWTVFGTSVAFAYSTVLFIAGAWLVWRSR